MQIGSRTALPPFGCWVGQGTIADRSDERLGRSDRVVLLMRKIYLRELQALAEGRPLKQWHRSERVLATLGV